MSLILISLFVVPSFIIVGDIINIYPDQGPSSYDGPQGRMRP
jgi:hypothetical protein